MSDYLKHYGVKGQKWGRRQWQNEDGTYTEAGKEHYGWGNGRQNRGHNGGEYEQRKTPWYAKDEYRNMGPKPHDRYTPAKPTDDQKRAIRDEKLRQKKVKTLILSAGSIALGSALIYLSASGKGKDWIRRIRRTYRFRQMKRRFNKGYYDVVRTPVNRVRVNRVGVERIPIERVHI